MTTFCTRFFFVVFLLLMIPEFGSAQSNYTAFWQPEVDVNYSLTPHYRHNFKVANRNFVIRSDDLVLDIRQIDFRHFSTFLIHSDQSISLGLMWRQSEDFKLGTLNEFRLTQKFNLIRRPGKVRLGHRVMAEQRISSALTVFRFRYRFAADLPLEGDKLDVGESYLISYLEMLLSTSKKTVPIYSSRIAAHIGWLLSPKTRIQLGLEHRLINYTRTLRHATLFETGLIFNL